MPPSSPRSSSQADASGQAPNASPEAGSNGRVPSQEPASSRSQTLRSLLARHITAHLPERPSSDPKTMPEPPSPVSTHAAVLPYLRAVPVLLVLAFAASFVWDFPAMTTTIWGHTLTFEGLLRILSVSGLIGFLTNWLAITMLFQPRTPRPIVGQGLVPAQRERIAYRLAEAVSDELISEEMIKEKIRESGLIAEYRDLAVSVTRSVLRDPDFRADFKAVATHYVDRALSSPEVRERIVRFTEEQIEAHARGGLPGLALRTYRMLYEDDFQDRLHAAVRQLPNSLDSTLDELDDLLDVLPEKMEEQSDDIEDLLAQAVRSFVENIDVERIVVENVRAYDERQLEELLKRTTNEQLNYIKYLGGVLGVLGGFVIWEPLVALSTFALFGSGIWLLDEVLFRFRPASPTVS